MADYLARTERDIEKHLGMKPEQFLARCAQEQMDISQIARELRKCDRVARDLVRKHGFRPKTIYVPDGGS